MTDHIDFSKDQDYIMKCGPQCDPGYVELCNGASCLDKYGKTFTMEMKGCKDFRLCQRKQHAFAPRYDPSGIGCDLSSNPRIRCFNPNPDRLQCIISPGCDVLARDGEPYRSRYNEAMGAYCMRSAANLSHDACIKWCKNNPELCDRNSIERLCNNEDIIANEYLDSVCGCFLPSSIYANVKKALADDWGMPNITDGKRKCGFPRCSGASLQYDVPDPCQKLEIVNCIVRVNFNVRNSQIRNIEIKTIKNVRKKFGLEEKPDDTKKDYSDTIFWFIIVFIFLLLFMCFASSAFGGLYAVT